MRRRDVILQKIKNLRKQHAKEYKFVMEMCQEYGSELAGDVRKKTNELELEIKHLETLLAMPEVNMGQEALKTRLADIKVDVSRIEDNIADIEKQKAVLFIKKQDKETTSDFIKKLLAISFD